MARQPALRLLLAAASLSAILLACAGLAVLVRAPMDESGPADAAVVLGAAAWNGRPSPVFQARIDHGVDLYLRGEVPLLVFTGGQAPGESLSEGEVGRDAALVAGVPLADLRWETTSRITWENLTGALPLLREAGAGRVLVVSDPLHLPRAVHMARDLGLDAHPSPTPSTRYRSLRTQVPFWAREAWFYSIYLVERGALSREPASP